MENISRDLIADEMQTANETVASHSREIELLATMLNLYINGFSLTGSLNDQNTDTNRRLERLYNAIETGKIDLDDLALRIRELRQRQEQLQAKRIEVEYRMSDRRVELVNLK